MPQQSLRNYHSSRTLVSQLLALESQYPDPPPLADRHTVEGLRGGAAVLMVAAFEQYLKEAVTEALESINTAAPPCDFDRLSESIRVSVVYSTLEAAMKGDHSTARLTKAQRLPDVLAAVARIHRRVIDASAVAQTSGNPTSEQVKSIFKSIGLAQVFNNVKRSFDARWGGPTATTFVSDTLDSIVRRRHTVAHTASALNVTRVDLAEGHRFLQTLVEVLDAALDRHTTRVVAGAQ